MVYQFIRYEIHDERTAFFWFDDWLKQGKIIEITGEVGICHLGVAHNARVCDAVTHAGWSIRGNISRFFMPSMIVSKVLRSLMAPVAAI